ncbi:hypothetical protein MAPG_05616 [Magnaporthiopsis poae ATCC 64411]|uniref:Uncharacterized protein n=1 Tax=Magnaporthiopsis poae (strain ATCC 64411 / 73-15) TaxID=644358 RepID=A0A0C4DZV5_MAGP6|nr:hypothetical protein MAPG_05616 [Magnaporthiopsis poae ATCC 64411]
MLPFTCWKARMAQGKKKSTRSKKRQLFDEGITGLGLQTRDTKLSPHHALGSKERSAMSASQLAKRSGHARCYQQQVSLFFFFLRLLSNVGLDCTMTSSNGKIFAHHLGLSGGARIPNRSKHKTITGGILFASPSLRFGPKREVETRQKRKRPRPHAYDRRPRRDHDPSVESRFVIGLSLLSLPISRVRGVAVARDKRATWNLHSTACFLSLLCLASLCLDMPRLPVHA